ncbi:MAG: hypothetical protein QOH15_887 [Gaiellales bacterium]|jgi:hypothetical protein|nr:hypothetical protein [Gaiellales bacterium]MDX6568309.1 hypothetical protein [Gaiellales bacterium]
MQIVRRRIGAGFVLVVALLALAAFTVASSAMAGTTSKHKSGQVAKHVVKKASAKNARLVVASKSTTPSSEGESTTEAGGAAESATDTAAQDAACKAAGVDPNGNVQFDDQTNTCSLDTGGTGSQQ